MTGPDLFDLERFVLAQDEVYDRVMQELRAGSKQSHWMWFVFPQFIGLGQSAMSRRYAIRSIGEATAFLDHPLLGLRYREAVGTLLQLEKLSAREILGSPDDIKLHSSLTLFARVSSDETIINDALARFFGGNHDLSTVRLLSG